MFFAISKGKAANKKPDAPQGALDLLIQKALQALGPLHSFGVACRLEELSEGDRDNRTRPSAARA